MRDMTPQDPVEFIRQLADRAPTDHDAGAVDLARAVEALAQESVDLDTNELLDRGVRLVAEHTGADGAVLYRYDHDRVRVLRRLRSGWSPRPEELPSNWFPWSLGQVSPTRFLFVADSRNLPIGPGASPVLGDIGVASCVHLPVLERQTPVGALQLFWGEPLAAWDDQLGPMLRNLGRFMVARAKDPNVQFSLT